MHLRDEPAPACPFMRCRDVARLFCVTTNTIRNWARSPNIALTKVLDDDGNPAYRRDEVMALYASGFRFRPRGVVVTPGVRDTG